MAAVKVCGITRREDAELAAGLGAWAVGLILWPGSPRACDPAAAAGIAAALRRRTAVVGVFVDPTLDELAAAADTIGLTHLQLHGDVGPAFCAEAGRRTGCRVIRAFTIRSGADVLDAGRFHVDYHLFDTRTIGGTGETWDWKLARQRLGSIPLIASGGLTPENVGEAIAAIDPWGVDVASGVESAPGIKDPDKVRAFLAAAGALVEAPAR